MNTETLKYAAQKIKEADAILICAGAGMGVDSGLPDFRGPEGFWKAYPPIAKLGLKFEEMANPRWFKENPQLAWAFYGHRRNCYRETIPHIGFQWLLELGQSKEKDYFVFTSNVDGQFQKAGFELDKILECHGTIEWMQCCEPCEKKIWKAGNEQIVIDADTFKAQIPLPLCSCGKMARPNILMFGDNKWLGQRVAKQEINLNKWLDSIQKSKLVIVELGAGTEVPSVRYFSESVARKYSADFIRINPREAQGPSNCISIAAGAVEGLKSILNYQV